MSDESPTPRTDAAKDHLMLVAENTALHERIRLQSEAAKRMQDGYTESCEALRAELEQVKAESKGWKNGMNNNAAVWEQTNAELEQVIAGRIRLRFHAEAMARRLHDSWKNYFGGIPVELAVYHAYRRDFPEPISEGSVEGHARRTHGESHVESAVLAGVESGPSETLSTQPVAAAAEREERALDALIAMALHPRSKEIQEGVARKLEEMQWHNPQAVPASALPPGHRFLRMDETTVPSDGLVWQQGNGWLSSKLRGFQRHSEQTYCTATP